jgi:nickel superoxide dismutase
MHGKVRSKYRSRFPLTFSSDQGRAFTSEHLWVLWTDYFKAPHFEAYPQLHSLFNEATKLAGAAGTKGTQDVAVADKLIAKIDEIAEIFWATKKA